MAWNVPIQFWWNHCRRPLVLVECNWQSQKTLTFWCSGDASLLSFSLEAVLSVCSLDSSKGVAHLYNYTTRNNTLLGQQKFPHHSLLLYNQRIVVLSALRKKTYTPRTPRSWKMRANTSVWWPSMSRLPLASHWQRSFWTEGGWLLSTIFQDTLKLLN